MLSHFFSHLYMRIYAFIVVNASILERYIKHKTTYITYRGSYNSVLAGVEGFEPSKCRSQSPMPYRLATPQYVDENYTGTDENFESPIQDADDI